MYFLGMAFLLAIFLTQKECFAGDGSMELQNGKNVIKEYYVKDQCMAQPGYFHLHHFSLAFFLQEHHICGGGPDGLDGLLICYRSQLEKSAMLPMGMQPTRQFELKNVAGNGVAKRCQELGPDWHGMLISTNDQRSWTFRFSTTNRTFTIGGSMKTLEWLFYKLASAKDGGESFLSKSFDPLLDFMKWKHDHFGESEEAENRISQVENEKLKKLFKERQAMEERLQNYAGIWSLGIDMLPTKEGINHFDIYVNKSAECCGNMKAFFNQPTAERPNPNLGNEIVLNDEPIENRVSIAENYTYILDGIIKADAKKLTFEIIDQLDPEDKSKGMRFIVDFEKKSFIFEQKIGIGWSALDQIIPNHFARGAPFHLVVILNKNGMTINVNCNGNQNLDAEIAFENPHLINIYGDYEYFNNISSNSNDSTVKSWMIDEGLYGKNSGGIMLQGKIGEKDKMFIIKFWHRTDIGYDRIFQLEVGIEPHYFKLLNESNDKETTDVSFLYNAGSQFEAIIKFNVNAGKTQIWMDNLLIGTLLIKPANMMANIVHFVQIVGDATAQMTKLRKSWINCTYEMSSKMQKSLKIVGKMLPRELDQEFRIRFYTGQNFLHLQMHFNMTNLSTELTIKEQILLNEVQVFNKSYELSSIKKGEIFHLDIHYKSASEFGLSINDGQQEIAYNAYLNLGETTFVTIDDKHGHSDDKNFGEDLIILKMDMTNCTNTYRKLN